MDRVTAFSSIQIWDDSFPQFWGLQFGIIVLTWYCIITVCRNPNYSSWSTVLTLLYLSSLPFDEDFHSCLRFSHWRSSWAFSSLQRSRPFWVRIVQVHLTTLYVSSLIKLLPVSEKLPYEKLAQNYLDNILLI